jgi:nanoRNase/pAp phosphatase (c-di-AMP/oligoRNAs hydrolase)
MQGHRGETQCMDVQTSACNGKLRRGGQPQPHGSPFSQCLDAELVGIISKVECLYREGRRTFVIVTHRDPDADAIAGCMGMARLIKGVLPGDVCVRWMHDGDLCSSLRAVCGCATEPISKLPSVFEGAPDNTVSIIVVDQPGLHSCAVLPDTMRLEPTIGNREADIVLDHHGDPRHYDGAVCEPLCGCTAALVYRLLQLAQNHERYRQTRFPKDEDERFALLVNVGARTDAGQSVVGPLSESVSPYVSWAVASTEGAFPRENAQAFDVLASRHASLVETARREALVYEGIMIGGVCADLCLAYAGTAESAHCIGACASKVFELERAKRGRDSKALPLAVVVCGIIRSEIPGEPEMVRAGERVQVSIRTEPSLDAEYIAHAISSSGGGRTGAAAVQLAVPKKYESVSDAFYVSRLLELLEVKLTWPEQFSWNLDARA